MQRLSSALLIHTRRSGMLPGAGSHHSHVAAFVLHNMATQRRGAGETSFNISGFCTNIAGLMSWSRSRGRNKWWINKVCAGLRAPATHRLDLIVFKWPPYSSESGARTSTILGNHRAGKCFYKCFYDVTKTTPIVNKTGPILDQKSIMWTRSRVGMRETYNIW